MADGGRASEWSGGVLGDGRQQEGPVPVLVAYTCATNHELFAFCSRCTYVYAGWICIVLEQSFHGSEVLCRYARKVGCCMTADKESTAELCRPFLERSADKPK